MSDPGYAAVVAFLEDKAKRVRRLEAEADKALQGDGGQGAYGAKMRDKAMLLAALPNDVAPLLKALDPDDAEDIRQRLNAFAASASRSLEIGSVFYMYALLYPEDHKPGELNDLERFTEELKSVA